LQYEPDIEDFAHSKVVIGAMDTECSHCHALKFKNKLDGLPTREHATYNCPYEKNYVLKSNSQKDIVIGN